MWCSQAFSFQSSNVSVCQKHACFGCCCLTRKMAAFLGELGTSCSRQGTAVQTYRPEVELSCDPQGVCLLFLLKRKLHPLQLLGAAVLNLSLPGARALKHTLNRWEEKGAEVGRAEASVRLYHILQTIRVNSTFFFFFKPLSILTPFTQTGELYYCKPVFLPVFILKWLISIDPRSDSNNSVTCIKSYTVFSRHIHQLKHVVLETKINEEDRCVNEIIIV